MKKFLSITMAAVCALTVSAVGLSACGETASDEVTAEEWAAAFEESNFYNVTVGVTATMSDKESDSDGNEETRSYDASGEVKVALTAADSYVTGNTYMNSNATESYTSNVDTAYNYSYTESATEYEVFTADSYSWVSKENYADSDGTEDEYWEGGQSDRAQDIDYSDAYGMAGMIIDLGLEEAFSYFTYSDGAYRYSFTEEGTYTFVTKINDGCISYLSVEVKYEDELKSYSTSYDAESGTYVTVSEVYATEVYTYKYEFNFSKYGKTSVTVPEEYTYEHYLANYAD